MATLIVTVLFGLIIAYFAIQNTAVISLNFLNYTAGIPAYIVIVGALLAGLFLSWTISFVNDIATGFTMRGKDSKIKDYKKENAEYLKQIHQLELENTRLKAESSAPDDDKSL
ncbi:MAG: lipopolysaccharide assembly protein LapA domain-containing protein [Candidatus Daviesbacteria bacterium]|nr:lipopolysaccharide assembly protein LapA domain-containing protein [Candidatus Daviesbacteria bacterium]